MKHPNFLRIPCDWIGSDLSSHEMLVLAMLDWCWEQGFSTPSDEFIGLYLGMHARKVQRLVKSLADKDWINRETVTNRSLQGGKVRYLEATGKAEPENEVCRQCGSVLSPDEEQNYLVHGLRICGRCADAVANWYSAAHSGEFFTWPNPEKSPKYKPKPPTSERLRWQVFKRDGYACLSCGATEYLRADHVIPQAEGGKTEIDNLQTLCRSCNSRKGTKTVDYRAEAS